MKLKVYHCNLLCRIVGPKMSLYMLCSVLSSSPVPPASVSEIQILAASVGGAIGVIIVLLIIFVLVRKKLKRSHEPEVELREREWKDPTVWWEKLHSWAGTPCTRLGVLDWRCPGCWLLTLGYWRRRLAGGVYSLFPGGLHLVFGHVLSQETRVWLL